MDNTVVRPRAAVPTHDLRDRRTELPLAPGWAFVRSPLHGEGFGPNEVIVWNRILLLLLQDESSQSASRAAAQLATMHLAIADAVAAVSGRHRPYAFAPKRPISGSHRLAAAAAAHAVLSELYPGRRQLIDHELALSLRSIPGGTLELPARSTAVSAAAVVLSCCRRDPPPVVAGLRPLLEAPYLVQAAPHLEAAPPPAMTSARYIADLAEVRSVGRRAGGSRLPMQSAAAAFWAAPSWVRWNEAGHASSMINHNSVACDARLFALLNVALADAGWIVRGAKRLYQVQRPAAAIRTEAPGWMPLGPSPATPSYPSLRSAQSVAAAIVLEKEFGNRFGLELPDPSAPAGFRRYSSFRAAAVEAGVSAIHAGVHFRFDHVEGERLGVATATYVQDNVLRPAGRSRS